MRPIDWIVLSVFLSFVAAYGYWRTRGKKDMQGFFLANKSMPWYAVTISIMATQASAITFLSTPGQAYVDGMRFVQFYFGPLFLVPVEVLGKRVAGMSTGFSNLFANLGSLTFVYSLGVVKDRAGAFTWGFVGISVACIIGVLLTAVMARMRNSALAAPDPRAA